MIEEVAKYTKKKPSSVSKSYSKAKHKHQYEFCKFRHTEVYHIPGKDKKSHEFVELGTYCTICGKIGDRTFLPSTERRQTFEEQHPDAPIFDVGSYSIKFVDIVDKS